MELIFKTLDGHSANGDIYSVKIDYIFVGKTGVTSSSQFIRCKGNDPCPLSHLPFSENIVNSHPGKFYINPHIDRYVRYDMRLIDMTDPSDNSTREMNIFKRRWNSVDMVVSTYASG